MNQIINIDVLEGLKGLADCSVQCCVTSPPYYGLRDYGHSGQLGLEATPEMYVSKMVEVFREVKRVLKNDGTLWLNIGDSYNGSKVGNTNGTYANGVVDKGKAYATTDSFKKNLVEGLKAKDLIGIPWMLAFALRADGWYLRQDIIWSKPNPMPESVTDRCTKSHEYIFMLSKSSKYYYDAEAIRTPAAASSIARLSQDIDSQVDSNRVPGKSNGTMKAVMSTRADKQRGHSRRHAGFNERWDKMTTEEQMSMGANKRSVWSVATMPYSEAHFATFPELLIVDPIKAGCPVGGLVLDPFMGAGTTALVASKLGRNYIGFELNEKYVRIAEKRLRSKLGLFMPTNDLNDKRSVATEDHQTTKP